MASNGQQLHQAPAGKGADDVKEGPAEPGHWSQRFAYEVEGWRPQFEGEGGRQKVERIRSHFDRRSR